MAWPCPQDFEQVEVHKDPRLDVLRKAAEQAPREVPSNAAVVERTGTAEQLLGLAECYLSLGSVVRAESLLERLVRDGFNPPRVSDLLWAVRGEFGSQRLSTEALLDELAGEEWMQEWGGHEHTETGHVGDVTAYIDPQDQDEALISGIDQQSFPALFRRDEPSGEVTEAEDDESDGHIDEYGG